MRRRTLPVGTVLLWDGERAARREPAGWRYFQEGGEIMGRYLGVGEIEALDTRPYTVEAK